MSEKAQINILGFVGHIRAVYLCCWRICLVCLSLELVGPCVVFGFSVGMEALMSSCQLMFLGARSSLESGFGLKPPTSSYQSYFYSSSKLLLLYSTIHKTSTLKMKSFSTVRVTQRGSQHYMKKRSGRRDLEVTQMR